MLNTEVSRLLGLIRDALLQSAVALIAASVLSFFLVPKQTEVIVDNGIPVQMMTLGGKDNPKAVYISTKKRKINPLPALFSIGAAAAAAIFKIKFDNDNNIISD